MSRLLAVKLGFLCMALSIHSAADVTTHVIESSTCRDGIDPIVGTNDIDLLIVSHNAIHGNAGDEWFIGAYTHLFTDRAGAFFDARNTLFVDFENDDLVDPSFVFNPTFEKAEAPGFVPDLLRALSIAISDKDIEFGLASAMDHVLQTALLVQEDTNERNDGAAKNAVVAFTHMIEAQRGKGISDEDADSLIAQALAILSI